MEIHPVLLDDDVDKVLERISSLAGDFEVFPVVGSADLISRIVENIPTSVPSPSKE